MSGRAFSTAWVVPRLTRAHYTSLYTVHLLQYSTTASELARMLHTGVWPADDHREHLVQDLDRCLENVATLLKEVEHEQE